MAESKNRDGEETQGIKVTDRRNFTREGDRREPDAPPEAAAPAMPAGPGPDHAGNNRGRGATARTAETRGNDAPGGARRSGVSPSADATPAPGAEPPSIQFVAFIQSLYMSALMALGEVENPYTNQFETNLDIARENIDILLMLQDKTRGNLSAEEQSYLSQALPQLQMLYVRKAR